jgi:hypothetical protein
VGSFLEPLLKKVTPVVGSRMLWVCSHMMLGVLLTEVLAMNLVVASD